MKLVVVLICLELRDLVLPVGVEDVSIRPTESLRDLDWSQQVVPPLRERVLLHSPNGL